jgi:DNA-binding response OmpR family regulator
VINFPSRVLIVDDTPVHLDILERAFINAGVATVVKAIDGHEAKLLMAEADPSFDLIVLDLCLPDFDGFEMLGHFDTCGSDTQFVLLSGMPRHMLDMAATFAQMKGLRLIGALQKPAAISELMEVVKSHDWEPGPRVTASGVSQISSSSG